MAKYKEYLESVLNETKESRELMKKQNLTYAGYGVYKDKQGNKFEYDSNLKKMKKLTLDTKVKLGDKFIDKYKGSKKEDKPLKKSILKKEEQIALLKRSVEKWNEWRKENISIIPDLRGANLQGANLQGAYLRDAYLLYAKLQGANLQGANLRDAYLQSANLQGANLRGANLRGANLRDADLRNANLQNANLQRANLRYVDLRYVDLRYADLRNADLLNADLQNANLQDVNLQNANLQNAKGIK